MGRKKMYDDDDLDDGYDDYDDYADEEEEGQWEQAKVGDLAQVCVISSAAATVPPPLCPV